MSNPRKPFEIKKQVVVYSRLKVWLPLRQPSEEDIRLGTDSHTGAISRFFRLEMS
jgi:hypothetical protein